MATTYEFIDDGKSFVIKYKGQSYRAGKNDVELIIPNESTNNTLKIRSNSAQLTDIEINLDEDTVLGVGAGSTTATQLDAALGAIFFLDDSGSAGLIREQISVFSENLNVGFLDHNKHFDILSEVDYNVILPKLSTVDLSYLFKFKNLNNSSIKGSFVPFEGEKIQGKTSFELYGKGTISIRKKYENYISSWVVVDVSNLFDHVGQGKSKEVAFNNHNNAITINHNRGYRPIVKVYVSDGFGDYSEAEVDIDHNESLNTFIVNLEGDNSGFIRYI